MKCRVLTSLLRIISFLLLASVASAQTVVDQILTLVNEDVITRTDLLWSIALDPQAPSPVGPVGSDVLSQKLDNMIEERLITQEATRIPQTEISQEEITRERTKLIARFPSEAAFRQRVESVGLTPQRIDELIRQRILIDRFIDFRFRSFVFVTEQEMKRYYDEVFAARMRKEGQVPPAIDAKLPDNRTVRDYITQILKQEKIEAEIDRWLLDARQRADIVQLAEP